jgi:hypothetical protein
MKTQAGILGLMLAAMLVPGCGGESREGRLKRFHHEAGTSLQAACSNDVVGFSRTIRSSVRDDGDNPALWTADVTLEFVNKVGGIERTNLPFYFRQNGMSSDNVAHVDCFLDERRLEKERIAEIRAALERLKR